MKKYLLLLPILILFGCKNNPSTKENNPDNNDSTKVLNTENKTSLPLAIQQQLGISEDMILPFDSIRMDSLIQDYKIALSDDSEGDDYEEPEWFSDNEQYIKTLIPYAFNDLIKRGFVPLSAIQFQNKLKTLGLEMQERKKIPVINEKKHYFTMPSFTYEAIDDMASDGLDKKELNYIKYGMSNDIFVKGYNFILPTTYITDYLKEKKGNVVFSLSDETIHLNKFLLNNDKASLAWLKQNSPLSLIALLKTYGYDTNESINNIVLADIAHRYLQDGSASYMLNTFIRKIFFNKPHMEIREGLLKSLLRLPVNEKNSIWLAMLDIYIDFLIKDATKDTYYWHSWFTQKERYKAAAYFAYYLFKLRAKYKETSPIFFSHELYYNKNFYKYLYEQKYFNLPKFKEICDSVYEEYDVDVKTYLNRVGNNG
ncbi:hypothetical protein KZY63_11965 [Prevotella histicola]|jgi:hypothetical protein|uniref:hypothetical protein n=1 Tax=Prevotella histicola TaxID=470565 RepID=UPI00046FA45C|nr:hypothetical protein [Prevotella histicola]MBW4713085.1 hypothetical protein [Prevotella histicola]MBW4877910.1 hypothetical protein [Prevotella histicola]MBW4921893.1 hypothetical protein [Prevotella histicola]